MQRIYPIVLNTLSAVASGVTGAFDRMPISFRRPWRYGPTKIIATSGFVKVRRVIPSERNADKCSPTGISSHSEPIIVAVVTSETSGVRA